MITHPLNNKTMKLTDILNDINKRENICLTHIVIYSDGSGAIKNEARKQIFCWNMNNNLPETILKAYKNHYKIDNDTLTL